MIGLCFKYDGGYQSLMREQYYELVKAFPAVTNIYERLVDKAEPNDYNHQVLTKINNADDLPTEPTLVVLSSIHGEYIKGDISLTDYIHPANVIYYFGDDHNHLTQAIIGIRTNYDKVYIPNVAKSLFSNQAMAIVLQDRQRKLDG